MTSACLQHLRPVNACWFGSSECEMLLTSGNILYYSFILSDRLTENSFSYHASAGLFFPSIWVCKYDIIYDI